MHRDSLPRRRRLSGLVGSSDALALARLAADSRPLAVVSASATDSARLLEELAWLAPALRVCLLPDWETLPYDSFSPHHDLVSERLATLYRILRGEFDVVLQNMRPGALDELGLGPDALRARYPRLIYCSLSAFGPVGPLKDRPGYEPMVQAFSSLMWLSGDEDDPPTRMGTSVLDFGTGMWAAMGVLATTSPAESRSRPAPPRSEAAETPPAKAAPPAPPRRPAGRVSQPRRVEPDAPPPPPRRPRDDEEVERRPVFRRPRGR